MRTMIGVTLSAALWVGPAPADDPADARAVLDKAITAAGGADKLAKLNAAVWTNQSTMPGRNSVTRMSGELPNKFRIDIESKTGDKTVTRTKIIDGERGWSVSDGKVTEMDAAELAGTKATFHHRQLATTLVPMLGNGYTLKLLGEERVGERRANVLLASHKSHRDVKLFIDTTTHEVLKSESVAADRRSGQEVKHEILYDDYHDFGGVKIARKVKMLHDGKVFSESKTVSFEAVDKLDAKTFRPPEGK